MIAGSTKKEVQTEICSACHPFYTGQQKLIDTAGRVDKFMARMKKAEKRKEKNNDIVENEENDKPVNKKNPSKKTPSKSAKTVS